MATRFCSLLLFTSMVAAAAKKKTILIAGDSWGTVIATGTFDGHGFFEYVLKEHGCEFKSALNIAIPTTRTDQWDNGGKIEKLTSKAKDHDLLWLTLMGNDLFEVLPNCSKSGKTAAQCGDDYVADVLKHMGTILDAVHEANPDMRVVGFGYDIMFGGKNCEQYTKELFPQCYTSNGENSTRCFNTQFIRIQDVWNELAKTRDYVDVVNLLGVTQVAGNVPNATVGHPNLDYFGPAQFWPAWELCIHPSIGKNASSASRVIMEEFYKQYWSKELGC